VRQEAFIDGSFTAAADGRTFEDVSPRDVVLADADDLDAAADRSLHALDTYTHLKTTWVGL
jgi:hypothetical protein